MAKIIPPVTVESLQSKSYMDHPNTDPEDVKALKDLVETGTVTAKEPDFAELHALFEMEYEQFITDTNHEILKCTQKLSELKALYGDSFP
jgi:hypothetical protein